MDFLSSQPGGNQKAGRSPPSETSLKTALKQTVDVTVLINVDAVSRRVFA
jgi:hypothetical protein